MAERPSIDLILGSASPRRASLLTQSGYRFRVETVDIDERAARINVADGDIVAATTAIAHAKFDAFEGQGGATTHGLLLTADTLVACKGVTMGKPASADEVAAMLAHMSGEQLLITTAVCVGQPGQHPRSCTVTTIVQLNQLTPADIAWYVDTNVGLDKAAGLALQSQALPFIAALDQCWSNVLGLPLCAVHALLNEAASDPAPHCSRARCGDYAGPTSEV